MEMPLPIPPIEVVSGVSILQTKSLKTRRRYNPVTIQWTKEPPTDQSWAGTRLLRCPAASPLAGITMDAELIGCPTHYAGGRTQPCQGTTCPMCLDGHQYRWHAYLPLYNPVTGRQFVLELTAMAAQDYRLQIQQHQSRAGLKLTVRRDSKRLNARVLLTLEPYQSNGRPLPTPIDVQHYLEHMWGLDKQPVDGPRKGTRSTEHKRHSPHTPPGDTPQHVATATAEAMQPWQP